MLIVIFFVIALAVAATRAGAHWFGDGWPEPPGQDDLLFGQQLQMQQQQEFQRQMEREQQQLQQELFDQFSRQSVTPIEQGGFVPNDQFGMPW